MIKTPINCVVADQPEYPELDWEVCGESACLNLENARKLALYLADVRRYHDSISKTCGEL